MSQSPNSHKRTFRNARFMMVATTPFPKRRDAQKHLTDAGLKLAYRAPHDHGDREYWSNPAGDRFGDHSATITPLKVAGKIRSDEHTSELQSLMRTSYAVFCLKKKINKHTRHP